jgi:hypothetical protein
MPLTNVNGHSAPSERTRVRRIAELAAYDRATLHGIIDTAYVCHVAFADERGTHCIPTALWRMGEFLYIHGSNGGRLMRLLQSGTQACVAITHVDGLVLARSAFNHSMNYRSAVVYGQFEAVPDEADKLTALNAFMSKLAPGRENEARQGNRKELGATIVLKISLAEASAKVRVGPPQDDEEDMAIQVWAGVLPMHVVNGAPVPAALSAQDAPAYVRNWAG